MADEFEILITVNNDLEATVVRGRLTEAGIHSASQPSNRGGTWNPVGARDVWVAARDLSRAREVLKEDEAISEERLVAEEELAERSEQSPGEG